VLGPPPIRDAARDLRRAGDRAGAVLDGRDGDRDFDVGAILAPPRRFEVLDPGAARGEAERVLAKSGLNHTILRPWYVLGPGHRWPYVLLPAYWLLEQLSTTRETAQRLGLVTLDQMVNALVIAAESPAASRVVEVPEIRRYTRISTP
jgi:uncharacterized protein YbjT (DUF2867 family)